MVICSYLLIAAPGRVDELARRISELTGCDVVRARDQDILLIVTESEDADSDAVLRGRIAAMDGVLALSLTFGEVATTT